MDQQVSPAVVVIVLILIVAILVGLYFLVVERPTQSDEGDPGMDVGPMDGAVEQADPGPDGAEDVDAGNGEESESVQPETDAEQTDENGEETAPDDGADEEDDEAADPSEQ